MKVQSTRKSTNASKVVSKVSCKFGRGDVRTIKFVANAKRVRVRCNGLPSITVVQHGEVFKAKIKVDGAAKFVTAHTPEAAYKKGVRSFWNPMV
jgi:hypothetical protein